MSVEKAGVKFHLLDMGDGRLVRVTVFETAHCAMFDVRVPKSGARDQEDWPRIKSWLCGAAQSVLAGPKPMVIAFWYGGIPQMIAAEYGGSYHSMMLDPRGAAFPPLIPTTRTSGGHHD